MAPIFSPTFSSENVDEIVLFQHFVERGLALPIFFVAFSISMESRSII
jgi:hypothetical protein